MRLHNFNIKKFKLFSQKSMQHEYFYYKRSIFWVKHCYSQINYLGNTEVLSNSSLQNTRTLMSTFNNNTSLFSGFSLFSSLLIQKNIF